MFNNQVGGEAEFVGAAAFMAPFVRPRFFLSSSLCSLSWEVYFSAKKKAFLVYMIRPVGRLDQEKNRTSFLRSYRQPLMGYMKKNIHDTLWV